MPSRRSATVSNGRVLPTCSDTALILPNLLSPHLEGMWRGVPSARDPQNLHINHLFRYRRRQESHLQRRLAHHDGPGKSQNYWRKLMYQFHLLHSQISFIWPFVAAFRMPATSLPPFPAQNLYQDQQHARQRMHTLNPFQLSVTMFCFISDFTGKT